MEEIHFKVCMGRRFNCRKGEKKGCNPDPNTQIASPSYGLRKHEDTTVVLLVALQILRLIFICHQKKNLSILVNTSKP